MVLRMMMCHFPSDPKIGPSIEKLGMKVFIPLVPNWIMSIQVHDSIVLQGPKEGWREQAERSQMIMQQEWPQLDNFRFRASVEYSDKSWGDCEEVKL
jgi:hypothetical protein